ncbi:23S rRNA (uracil(1939)-C(5))-methyltransferase RlmD [Vallitalea guaymasensis]|uniref:23S rRNA (uracil(1939)-C(5))-methyltransferase RlmD n=1 Tax=Vallitalea guaymasensis TaxID=1185412 RepID=UPI0023539C66|nr:23S rRNA (uracil(1939)-C(5))-methyltransferase RlmD [Vallitalea guaymasensis]
MKAKNVELPVVKNEYYEMVIDDLGINGEGIGKINGYTLFVDGALPQEKIKVKVIKTKKNFGFGKLIDILEPSIHRIDPVCDIAKRCGGCQLQHLSYEGQLNYKQKKVQDIIERIGGITDIEVNKVIGMEKPYFYRNKVQFPVGGMGDDSVNIGFYAMRSHNIITTDKCYIQQPVNKDIIGVVKEYMLKNNVKPYNEVTNKGVVRHIVTRVSFHTKEIMVGVVINGNKLPNSDELVSNLRKIEDVAGIFISVNKEKTNVIMGNKIKMLWGKPYITDYIGEVAYNISPLSFYQVNPVQTEKLYSKVLEFADLSGDEIVWDAYCGIGTISLFLAGKSKKVMGVEIVPEAIEDAKKNAELNDISNTEFYVGKAEEVITGKYNEGVRADVIVVDPPRKGCDRELLETIMKMQPEKVVYVSCDPGTMARDVKVLGEGGYRVEEVQPVDMFPQTVHVECVTVLRKL